MSKGTTAFVLVGPSGVGAFHDPLWRVWGTAQLVEGGSNGPYWLTAPGGHNDDGAGPESLVIDSDDPQIVARSVVALLAASVGDDALIAHLERAGLITVADGRRVIRSPWHLSGADLDECAESLSVRIGIVRLAERSALDDESVMALRSWGFTVDEFTPTPAA
ncbi:hypothetical protein [Cryobacterium sp.]|uniref:hypothetical protein n=1 Tax=Cryobacterium sp. TaxID=1926290 RepID=UPI002639238E|nr:hypothetical protein [Cryobacterium sp.]MCU1445269.1 hypothetical protein [Cryobacterium sp.]